MKRREFLTKCLTWSAAAPVAAVGASAYLEAEGVVEPTPDGPKNVMYVAEDNVIQQYVGRNDVPLVFWDGNGFHGMGPDHTQMYEYDER